MRMSRVLLAGVAVVAAGAATTAFTAANTVPTSVAGYAANTVSGAVVTNIQYVPDSADHANLGSVVFTTSTNLISATNPKDASMSLRDSGGTILGAVYDCTLGTTYTTTMTITCPTADTPEIDDFTSVGLSVYQLAPTP